MAATSNPRINIQLLPAAIVDAFADRRDLICGVLPTAATATSGALVQNVNSCLLYTSPSPRDQRGSRMPSSA